MSGFMPSALGGFVQGMRISDEDQRRDNRQALATRYADDQHNVSALNLQNLQQQQADDSEFRTELGNKYNTSPGKARALTLNAQMTPYLDEAAYRKELQDNGYSVPGERAKKTITEAEAREHQNDVRTTVQGFISAKQSGNWKILTDAMSKTHLGGGGNGETGRTYTPEWTDKTLKITDSKGDVILDLVGKDKDDLALKVEQALTQSVANPDVYFAGRAKERSALNLEAKKHNYKLDEIRAASQAKAANSGKNKRYITLPTADRRGERISFEDARKELTDIGKFLKEKSGKEGMSFFIDTNVNMEDLYKTNTGKMAIQRIEEIAADKSNSRAQGYAQRFLAIADSMYGVPDQSKNTSSGGFGYGKRADGTEKGRGFLGELKRPDGMVSTELSIGVNLGGKETEIPTLIPTLTQDEINYLLKGGAPTKAIVEKAVSFARKRIQQGKSPFAEEWESPEGKSNPDSWENY